MNPAANTAAAPMRAAWYERNGAAAEVLTVGELPRPEAGAGEVRVRLVSSAANPSDVKSRAGSARRIAFPRQVPHSDGAGVVGHYAVQLAKWAGARVLTTVGSAEKVTHALAAGADAVIDYRREDVAARVLELTDGEGVDRIVEVEFGGNLELDLRVAKMGAVIAAYGSTQREPQIPFFPLVARNLVLRLVHMYGLPRAAKDAAIAGIGAWIASGRARFTVAARYPLERIAEAHEAVEAGRKLGQVLIDID